MLEPIRAVGNQQKHLSLSFGEIFSRFMEPFLFQNKLYSPVAQKLGSMEYSMYFIDCIIFVLIYFLISFCFFLSLVTVNCAREGK